MNIKKFQKGCSEKYNVNRLLYYEEIGDVTSAINREKQLKKWRREWKENLINTNNPEWRDLWNEITQL